MRRHHGWQARKTGVLACALLLLAACGGGGGGGAADSGGGTAPPAAVGGRLAFTPANVGQVAGYPLWASEMILRLGQVVSEDLVSVNPHRPGGCTSDSTLQRNWADLDGSSTLSAGDQVTLRYTGCARHPLTTGMDGLVTATLISVGDDGDFEARLVLSQPGVAIGYTTGLGWPSDFRIFGQVHLRVSHTDLHTTFELGNGSTDTISIGFPGVDVGADSIGALRLRKTHRWDVARTHLDLQMRYDSPELGGAYDVATLRPLIAWLDTLPEPGPHQGEIQMLGRGGDEVRVQVAGAGGLDPSDIGGWLDQGGDGSQEVALTGRWTDVGAVTGVFFADYTRWGRGGAFAYDANAFEMRRGFVGFSTLPVDSVFPLQFTRPVAGAAGWRFRLLDRGRLDQMPTAGTDVAVQVELHEALVVVRPAEPLRYSRRYELRVETGESVDDRQLIRATTGGTLWLSRGYIGEFQTPDFLNPTSNLAARPTLMAGVPLEATVLAPLPDAPPSLRYRWSQVSGPPVIIARPDERTTPIELGSGAVGIASATVRLTVSVDGAGNSESRDYVLRTVADTSDTWLGRLRVPSGLQGHGLPPRESWSGPAVGSLMARLDGDRLTLAYEERADPDHPHANWSVELRSADGRPLQPGRYENAYSSTWYARPPGVPTLDVLHSVSGEFMMDSVQGEFVIHELEADASGNVTRLALDFLAPSGPFESPGSGAVRIDSAWALPP